MASTSGNTSTFGAATLVRLSTALALLTLPLAARAQSATPAPVAPAPGDLRLPQESVTNERTPSTAFMGTSLGFEALGMFGLFGPEPASGTTAPFPVFLRASATGRLGPLVLSPGVFVRSNGVLFNVHAELVSYLDRGWEFGLG